MTEVDRAWVAGLLEGEGTFHIRTNQPTRKSGRVYGPYSYPTVSVCMTDRDVLHRLRNVTGMGTVAGPYHRGGKPIFYWKVTRGVDALTLMFEVLPHMGERRSDQIQVLLEQFDPDCLVQKGGE